MNLSDFIIKDDILTEYRGDETNIIIPEGVKRIGPHVFQYNGLKSIQLPSTLEHIDSFAFEYCGELTEITFPPGLLSIGDYAFENCRSLKNTQLPASLNSVGWYGFSYCLGLTEFSIPEGVTHLHGGLFKGCKNLEKISIPESVSAIDGDVFAGTAWLKARKKESQFVIVNGLLIHGKPENGVVNVPDTVNYVTDKAFFHQSKIKKVIIPDGVTVSSHSVFKGCTNLTCIVYHGIPFTPHWGQVNPERVFRMIDERNFSASIFLSDKYEAILNMFFRNPEDEELYQYIRKNILKIIKVMTDQNQTEFVRKLLEDGRFITKRNIDKLIQYAIDNRKIEIQLMLMNYKAEKIGYDSDEEIIRKKFSL